MALLAVCAWTDVARAQGTQGAEAQLEELIVTARKREETLQSAPVSVGVTTAEEIAQRGLRDISEVALTTPGFSMQNIQSGTEQPFIRGMASTSFERTLQTASSLHDGVYASALGRTVFFPDLERVEVIRGPQAALFGRATFGGAINYILKGPTSEPHGAARLLVGEHDRREFHASQSGPLIPGKLEYRLSWNAESFGGEYVNRLDGMKTGQIAHSGFTAALRFLPVENVDVNLRVLHTKFRDDGQVPEYLQPSSTLNCFPNAQGVFTYFCGKLDPDPTQVSMNLRAVGPLPNVSGGYQNLDQTRSRLSVDWRLDGGYVLSSTTAHVAQKSATFCDCDYSDRVPLAGAFHSLFRGEIENISQELRIASPTETRFRWLAGVYYFKEDSWSVRANVPVPPPVPYIDVINRSVFGSVSFDVTDDLTLSLDARYQKETQKRVPTPGIPRVEVDYTGFLPRAILEYRASPAAMVYVSAAKGNQPGQFNTGSNIPADLIKVDEETLWSYEAGAKTQWLDNRLRINLAVYRIDWENQVYRAEAIGANGALINVLRNLGGSRINGLELEAAAVITEGLRISGTYAYVDAKYENFISPNTLRVYGRAQAAGQQLPNTPKHQGSFLASYTQPLPALDGYDWYVRANYAYRGRQYVSEVNQAYIGALHLLNLHAGIQAERFSLDVALNNALDSDVPEFATRFSDTNSPGLSRFAYLIKLRNTRAVNVTLRYDF